eukprot:Gregarina_sp_Pseudo_9__1583@NODE_2064_length_1173_cov_997_799824_g1906_i0_p1_GENE_NODE_2064_length_1173_cov_997_799824_g1906_i0NODE_2064_length_1173_cov_997_799824_g1906_i0_p1_ORF_typecomplete_len290_score47_37MGC24/PF05283_11/0_29DNA_pol_viral_N/PF00242_17/0_29Mucin/PF01456_17/0_79Alpha_GJ/PF03229_13/1_3e04Alpha_GJ/PF03229_13/0_079Dicty_REP/PF05086_12/1_5Med3/PF11593_8/1_9AJAP1_PANP_C/PF15298_6/9_2e03AJAP1_PANP_C/PF15298_6/1_7_NODE_2064_length_1173_cov_997_799824_g1906_i02051074
MNTFFVVAALFSLVSAQDGTCVAGVDPMGQEQSCLGRCHVYYEGNYGACGDQVTASQVTSNCGDSAKNACISTFNAAWDGSKGNCGNCYYVEMDYDDGTTTHVYLKTIDTNASETKFEMMQYAWEKLCPYLCAGTGTCGHSPSSCTYGVQETNWDYPGSCAVQYAPVRFKRVSCDGDEGETVKTSTKKKTSTTTTTTTTPHRRTTATTTRRTTTTTTTRRHASTTDKHNSAVSQCQGMLSSSNSVWTEDCANKCEFFHENPQFCSQGDKELSGKELAECVAKLTGYCVY